MIIDETILLDYVMGALTADQEQAVAAYLNAHPQEAAWVRDMFEATADVALAVTPEAVEAGAADALLARIRQTPDAALGTSEAATQDDEFGSGFNDEFNYDDSFGFDSDSLNTDTRRRQGSDFDLDTKEIDTVERNGFNDVIEDPFAPKKVIRLEPRRRAMRTIMTTALAASILALGWLGFREPLANYQISQRLQRTCALAGVRCEPIAAENGSDIGTLARLSDTQVVMVFNSAPPAGQVYQAWEIAGDTPVSLGVWSERVLEIPRPLAEGSTFGITLEPPGGSPQPTSTPIVAVPLNS